MLIHSYVCSTICTWKYFCPFSCWILHVNVTYFNGFYFFRLEFCKNIISSCTIHLCLCLIHRHMVLKKRRPSLYRVFSLKFFQSKKLYHWKDAFWCQIGKAKSGRFFRESILAALIFGVKMDSFNVKTFYCCKIQIWTLCIFVTHTLCCDP